MSLKVLVIQKKIFQCKDQKVKMKNPFAVIFIENNL